jgi:serine/threonine protein kinase
VIDFGVAKATEQKLTERTLFTQYGTMVGTLEYTSPEQAEMSALGVDTRSDIYSLGVLLYELLTGSTPLCRMRVREATYGEIVRMIKEDEPARPSTRLCDSVETLASISAQRRMEPAKLTKLLRGDLDWIVMKALEKDRNRRYATANGLATDVQRYLNDEPVQACPPSALYRFRKLARRNKGAFGAGLATALVLVLALVGLSVSNILITRETAQKELALKDKDAALRAARASEKEARTKEAIARAAQQEAHENLNDARAAVDQMLSRVADRLAAVPQMEDVRQELLEEAVKFYQKFLDKEGDDPVIRRETALAYRSLANLQFRFGQRTEAEQSFRKAFALFEELGTQSPLEPSTRASLVPAHHQFAQLLFELGNLPEHDEHLHRAARLAEDLVQEFPGEPLYRDLLVGVNANLIPRMRLPPDQEEEMLRRNLKLTESPYNLGFVYLHLGHLGVSRGRYPEAEKDYRNCVEKFEIVESQNPSSSSAQRDLSIALVHLADALTTDRRWEEAEAVYRRAIAKLDKLATDNPRYHLHRREQAETQYKYASLLTSLDRAADAEEAYRRAAELSAKLAAEFPTVPTDD